MSENHNWTIFFTLDIGIGIVYLKTMKSLSMFFFFILEDFGVFFFYYLFIFSQ